MADAKTQAELLLEQARHAVALATAGEATKAELQLDHLADHVDHLLDALGGKDLLEHLGHQDEVIRRQDQEIRQYRHIIAQGLNLGEAGADVVLKGLFDLVDMQRGHIQRLDAECDLYVQTIKGLQLRLDAHHKHDKEHGHAGT